MRRFPQIPAKYEYHDAKPVITLTMRPVDVRARAQLRVRERKFWKLAGQLILYGSWAATALTVLYAFVRFIHWAWVDASADRVSTRPAALQ